MGRLNSFELCRTKQIKSASAANVNWLALDRNESRYLLACGSDSSVAAFDVLSPRQGAAICSLFKVDRLKVEGHKYSVSTAAWYPIDTGLFVTGSADETVKVRQAFRTSSISTMRSKQA